MKLLFYLIILFSGITSFAQEKQKEKLVEWFKHLNGDSAAVYRDSITMYYKNNPFRLNDLHGYSLIVSVQKPTIRSNMPMLKSESKDPMPSYNPPDSIDYKIGKYEIDLKGDSTRIFRLPKLKRE